jgi:hypothetical protein
MDTRHLQLSRRTVLTTVAASALVAVTTSATGAAGASAAATRQSPAPETVDLPDGIRPEGITSGPGTTYYVGSLSDGRIVTGDLLEGTVTTLLPGAAGRSLRGLFWCSHCGMVWAVGDVTTGSTTVGHVWCVDATTGAIMHDVVVPGAGFLNDLVVSEDKVFVTDSFVDRITVISHDHTATTVNGPSFVPLTGAWPAGNGTFINANGIRLLPDGDLVLNNSQFGGLWQVDPGSGATTSVRVTGGPGIVSGDGLLVDGNILYNVRGVGQSEVAVLRLSPTGSGWTAKWAGDRTDPTLDVPSTATLAGGWIWAVNARFGVASPDTAPYWITRLPAA